MLPWRAFGYSLGSFWKLLGAASSLEAALEDFLKFLGTLSETPWRCLEAVLESLLRLLGTRFEIPWRCLEALPRGCLG